MSEEETIKSFKSLMYNAKANWDYFSYEILFNFFSLYNNAIEENKKLNEYKENYIPIQKIKDKQKEKKWALESYYCSEADYKQSQAVGAWSVLQELIEEREKN